MENSVLTFLHHQLPILTPAVNLSLNYHYIMVYLHELLLVISLGLLASDSFGTAVVDSEYLGSNRQYSGHS